MSTQLELAPAGARNREYEAERRGVETRVDAAIARIDVGASPAAVAAAEAVVNEGSARIEGLTLAWLARNLQAAMASVAASAAEIGGMVARKAAAVAELETLPPCGVVQAAVAALYLLGFLVAFFTELKLTDSLVDLLGYRKDDSTGKAIGAAFASAMLLFDLIFTRLGLTADPWELFRGASSGENAHDPAPPSVWTRRWRGAGFAALVVTLLGVAWLQVYTIVKVAPTRSIDAAYIRAGRALTPREEQVVEESALLFSVCVLVSGGFMAAAGTRELSLRLHRRALAKTITELDRSKTQAFYELTTVEMPEVASALEGAGLPSLWLAAAPLEQVAERLREAIRSDGDGGRSPAGLRGAAAAEARIFQHAKQIELAQARNRPAAPRLVKSWRETVGEALGGAA